MPNVAPVLWNVSNAIGVTVPKACCHASDAALVEAGGDLQLGPQTKVGVSYVGQLANNARDHSVKANFSWRF